MGDEAVLQAIDERAGHLDAPAGRRHAKKLARMAAGDAAQQAHPVLVDEQIFGPEHQVGETP